MRRRCYDLPRQAVQHSSSTSDTLAPRSVWMSYLVQDSAAFMRRQLEARRKLLSSLRAKEEAQPIRDEPLD
eukprot:scaffold91847_cov33-Tisochrysis_lutea.AAC.1